MSVNSLLSELVVIANSLDNREKQDVVADLDAAIFILSLENAIPVNKSLASIAREIYAAADPTLTEEQLDDSAAEYANQIMSLTGEILDLDPKVRLAVLKSIVQGMRAFLRPEATLSLSSLEQGAELLAEAERKLSEDDTMRGVGYRVGVIRSELERINDG